MNGSCVDLQCADYTVTSASIAHSPGGAIYRCTISPLTDQIIERLAAAAQSNGTIRLVFPKMPLLLERVEVKRIEPGCVRIRGQIVA